MHETRRDASNHGEPGRLVPAEWTAARLGQARAAVADRCLLAVSCLITYWLATTILALASVSRADNVLGGMWAVIATVFVVRHSYRTSLGAALSRMAATLASFVLCLQYLLYLPFHAWALAALIGLSALTVTLIGRPGTRSQPQSPPQSSWSWPK